MKTVDLTIILDSWYAHASAGQMRLWFYGGRYNLEYKGHVRDGDYIDPHSEKYIFSSEGFIMDKIIEAMNILNESCIIRLHLPEKGFIYDVMRKGIYKYWKANDWCLKSGAKAGEDWIEFDRVLCEKGHIIQVVEL